MSEMTTKEKKTVPSLFTDFFGRDFFSDDFFTVGNRLPAANVSEGDGAYTVELSAPGFEKKDFKVRLEDDVLIVEARREEEKKEEGERYNRREFRTSSFTRSFRMPEAVIAADAKAKYENGILRLVLPKKHEERSKELKEINVS